MAKIIPFSAPRPPAPVRMPATAPAHAPAPVRPPADAAARKAAHRRDMLAKIHMAKAQLIKSKPGYTDYIYRATLEDMYGVASAATLTPDQMHELLLHLVSLGWQKRPRKGSGRAPTAYAQDDSGLGREGLLQKIEALLTEKGRAEGSAVPWAYAVGILKRQSDGITKSLDQADRSQLTAVIAALWRDAKRKRRRVR